MSGKRPRRLRNRDERTPASFSGSFLVLPFSVYCFRTEYRRSFLLGPSHAWPTTRHALQVGRSQNNVFILNPFLPYVGAAFVHPPPFMIRRDRAGELLGIESLFCPPGRVEAVVVV